MNYQLPASLPAAKNYEVKQQPINAQSFTAGNVIQFDLNCGKRGTYLDTATTYLRFRATYTHAGTAATDVSNLMGSAYSYFNKLELYGNNSVLLEQINEYGLLASMLINCTLNESDKVGLAPMLGINGSDQYGGRATQAHIINDAAPNLLTFDYAIPLISLIGSGTDKFFPIGAIYGLRLELSCDDYKNFTIAKGATNKITGLTISDVELVYNVVELGPEAQSLIEQQNGSKIHIRAQSYRQASNTLAASSGVGTQDILVGLRLSSLKSIYMCCSPSNAYEGKFAGVNPNLTQGTCFTIAGQNYPQRTSNPSDKPADSFAELQKSFGALSFSVFNGCISKGAYYNSSTANGLMIAYTSNASYSASGTPSNQFYYAIDTEVVARKQNLLSGINVNSSPMFFRAQIGKALSAYVHTLNFFAFYDLILEIDTQQRNIIAKF
jgi:hypothetical protein